jgi:quinol monooxygenase YgiN
MLQRIVDCQVRPEKLNELRRTLNERFIPRIKNEPGFVDIVESADSSTGEFVCQTFWKTQDDVDRYASGLFQEIASELTPLLRDEPKVRTLEVETSTPHKIAARRAAA